LIRLKPGVVGSPAYFTTCYHLSSWKNNSTKQSGKPAWSPAKSNVDYSTMMIDDDTLKQLLRINDELLRLCKWLNEKRDMETSSRLIPLVDDLTHILIEAGKNKLH
jgi:hypothetical protein